MRKAVVTINPDEDFVKEMKAAIKANNKHCPCQFEYNKDTVCKCKSFREQSEDGWCHCGLYYKEFIEVDDE